MKTPLYGTTANGKPVFDNPAYAQGCFAEYEGKRFLITLEPESKKRSTKQNAYYWATVIGHIHLFLKGHGNQEDKTRIHEMLQVKFLMDEMLGPGGEILGPYPRSTTDLSTIEFTEYIENCRQWAAEVLKIDIPDPAKEYGRKRIHNKIA